MKFSALPLVLSGGSLVRAAVSGQQLRILPLGDSITAGATSPQYMGGYRRPLVSLLDGNYVNMVGSLSDGLFRDNNHEGWAGYGINDISKHYLNNGGHANPNVVILHAGTNDLILNQTASAPGNLESLMKNIQYLSQGNAILVLARIGPWCSNQTNSANLAPYNANVTALYNKYAAAGWKIVLADVNAALNPSTDLTCDSNNAGVHPNAQGYNKIAQVYYNALNSVQTNHPSWFTPMVNSTFGGTTGYYVCPTGIMPPASAITFDYVNPFSVSGLAGAQNQYNGIFCLDVSNNPNVCSCSDPSGPNGNGYTYTVAKTRSCLEMTTVRTQAVTFADINGDGRADYLYVSSGGQVNSWLYSNQTLQGDDQDNNQAASGSFYSQGNIFGGAYGNRSQVRFADVNGDGLADYLQVFPNGAVSVYSPALVYTTSNTQAGPGFYPKGQIFNGTYNNVQYPGAGLVFVDINGDSLADLVYVSFAGVVTVLPNLGPSGNNFATFGNPQNIYTAPSGFGRDNIILSDTNGDGHADLVLLNRTSGAFNIYENLGSNGNSIASFNTTARYSASSLDGQNGNNVQFASIGGNGRADWIDVDPNTSAFTVRSNVCSYTIVGFGYIGHGLL